MSITNDHDPTVDDETPSRRSVRVWTWLVIVGLAGAIGFGGLQLIALSEQNIVDKQDDRTLSEMQRDALPNLGEVVDGIPQPLAQFKASRWQWKTYYTGFDDNGVPKPLPVDWEAAQKDEITAASPIWSDVLVIPTGREVVVRASSSDMVHRAVCPDLTIDEILVPGRHYDLAISAAHPGEWPLYCREFCGNGHSQMTTRVIAMKPNDWKRWRSEMQDAIVEEQSFEKRLFDFQYELDDG